jgi:hypothetical protein
LRTGSQAFTAVASTVSEKKTFPSETTTSESTRLSVNAVPSGEDSLASAARTSCLLTDMSIVRLPAHHRRPCRPVNATLTIKTVDAHAPAMTYWQIGTGGGRPRVYSNFLKET